MVPQISFINFNNPFLGNIVFARVLREVVDFMTLQPLSEYKIMIGSDSNGHGLLDVVSVIAVHRKGNGGRYFWTRTEKQNIKSLRQKIYAEVEASLGLAAQFLPAFRQQLEHLEHQLELPFDFEIHVDVGSKGETRDLISEITGMVRGYGYNVFIKPESAAATTVADRHVR